jgi:hypothetical protein
MTQTTIISNAAGCFIQLIHKDSNPTVWIVRRSKKFLWFKKTISSDWFTSGPNALEFARKMKQQNVGGANLAYEKERV